MQAYDAVHSKMDSREEHTDATLQGSRVPGLFPVNNMIPSQNHITPALQLLLQLGRFRSLNINYTLVIGLFFKCNNASII